MLQLRLSIITMEQGWSTVQNVIRHSSISNIWNIIFFKLTISRKVIILVWCATKNLTPNVGHGSTWGGFMTTPNTFVLKRRRQQAIEIALKDSQPGNCIRITSRKIIVSMKIFQKEYAKFVEWSLLKQMVPATSLILKLMMDLLIWDINAQDVRRDSVSRTDFSGISAHVIPIRIMLHSGKK